MVQTVSAALARRVAVAAQGFGARSTATTPGIRQLHALVNRLGLLQIDSVNVFERSHYLPAFSRLGHYDKAQLDRLTTGPGARLTEYWAHEASYLPLDTWPLFRWRMEQYRSLAARTSDSWAAANRPLLNWLLAALAANGPMRASEVEHDANKRSGPWWGWSDVKLGLETLFRWGDVAAAGRVRFERVYGLPEQVYSPELLGRTVTKPDAHRELIGLAARAHGIGTAKDLADYFRLKAAPTLHAIRELEDSGDLTAVTVPEWGTKSAAAWMHRDARLPRRIQAATVLSPFDPVVWERARALRMFNFHYRIEIYTPEPKRVFGYYSLPILLDEAIVGRVDLKNDRQAGVLRVQAAWSEAGAPADTAERLAPVLREAAAWQNLSDIVVVPRGTLAPALARALRS
ncbi:winged helix-turn-helix domain-containing protein [Cryobacterium psychrophilum]|uniref:Winged helix-turn-helix domain-containing protein n=1 Tax=Cryobacterium psychrophilum TaxID=41988 RepID=A0A4Y8KJZ0_9MICO|nr:crosslink repair DNA glycosylase YcaQ family protein [Cryobacterium psychrophilum]TDW30815.1 hypothetical protein EDD25_2592 [Cryobacterium psychrophilum]TFD75789.1 winged helix-turn-helix domain-containing protein [Cryobacterium psychrophilum]